MGHMLGTNSGHRVWICFWLIVFVLGGVRVWGKSEMPKKVQLSDTVASLLEDPGLTEAEQRRLAIFHGQWEQVENPTVAEAAEIAFAKGQFNRVALTDDRVPLLLRSEVALELGQAERALTLVESDKTARGNLVQAKSLLLLGKHDQAEQVLIQWRSHLIKDAIVDAGEMTAAAEMVVMLARLQGRPAQDYHLAMSLFGKARGELDRLYWPAYLGEARLLIEKDNPSEAVEALAEALTLNPRCGQAWLMLGQLAARGFGFDRAARCIDELRKIDPEHFYADLVEIDVALIQKDGRAVVQSCERLLQFGSDTRGIAARMAAGHALMHEQEKAERQLVSYEKRWPGDAMGHYLVGRYLSLARQYDWGEKVLRRAIEIEPNWARPQVELGLLLMQSGDEAGALGVLRRAVKLDEFNRRAYNQLELVEELSGYQQIETEHFVIRYRAGVDEVLARDMPERLEQIYTDVTEIFQFKPERRTVIEILPNKRYLGARVIGLPDIWTIAACTGDVIAMVPPRVGKSQYGTFDWPTVLRHEFVHTVTLNQTGFRIPHWFTEGCGVWQEPVAFDYERCKMLADALNSDGLFDLDEIDWAFIRPEKPTDRGLAYAQAGWMVRYIVEQFGTDALVGMLHRFENGDSDIAGIEAITGEDAKTFVEGFKNWAQSEVKQWGFYGPIDDPKIKVIVEVANKTGGKLDDQQQLELMQLLKSYPDHPDLIKVRAELAIAKQDWSTAWDMLLRYGQLRPIDRWADKQLVQIAAQQGRLDNALDSMQRLDHASEKSGKWAVKLMRLHRGAGRLAQASESIRRALEREPFDAGYRELAAAVELQRGELDIALHHVRGLTLIEPERLQHWRRLAALLRIMGDDQGATQADQRAAKLEDTVRHQ